MSFLQKPTLPFVSQKIISTTVGSGIERVVDAKGKAWIRKYYTNPMQAEAEYQGLAELFNTKSFPVPEFFLLDSMQIILREITPSKESSNAWILAGKFLAKLHTCTPRSNLYGWPMNNFIGSNPQENLQKEGQSWADFYMKHRLEFQMKLLQKLGGLIEHMYKLWHEKKIFIHSILESRNEISLLHGDLWRGNLLFSSDGLPHLIDPACYYGDPETDLAMTKLFGPFDKHFYQAYHSIIPKAPGYQQREKVYQLYHLLNHANLFGRSYVHLAYKSLLDI
ncbi:MAG: fructosamine kinase family protein [Bdellovibrionales bacterium]|nr:fructosamine kinase family protein [Bdellovibrionales bacterium]